MNTKGVESVGRSRVRGKKRMEIIKKFLEGEEDPDYEVIPTVTEGKYFVRPRKGSKSKNKSQKSKQETKDDNKITDKSDEQSDDDVDDEAIERSKDHELRRSEEQKQNGLSEPLREERCSQGQSPNKVPKNKKKEPKLKQQVVKKSEQVFYDPTISYQILEQLKLLGEEQRLKRTKKEQKKLVKHQIQKQLKRKEQEQESSSSSEEYDYEVVDEEPKKLFKPTPLRRRVNLNK